MIKLFCKLYLWAENIWFKLPQKLRFLLVGGFNTVFAYSILALILWIFENINNSTKLGFASVLVANAALFVQYVITINVSFLTMRYYVFQSHGDWKKEFVKAWSVYLFLYLINSPILSFLMVIVGLSPLVAQALYLTFSTIATFILHKYYSFRQRTQKQKNLFLFTDFSLCFATNILKKHEIYDILCINVSKQQRRGIIMRMFQILLVLCLTVLSATSADARICFLPASGTCGDYAIVPCDEKNTFKKESDCNAAVLSYVQVCKQTVKDGCWKKFCKYENKAACDKEADSLSSSSLHYSCSVDNDSGCYYLESTPCIAPSRDYHKACSGYEVSASQKTDYENDGYTCSSCEKSWTDYSCNSKGIVESTEGSETVYSCSKETNTTCYYTLTESEARDYENDGYTCTDCTPTTTTTDDQGNSNTVEGNTVYKCTKTTSTTCDPEYNVPASEKADKEAEGYNCDGCTPTTTYWEDGKDTPTNGEVVYKCSMECTDDMPTSQADCQADEYYAKLNDKCGNCLSCKDEDANNNPQNPCYGQGRSCWSEDGSRYGAEADKSNCSCGNVEYYKKCMTAEKCNVGAISGTCTANTAAIVATLTENGYYKVDKTCTTSSLKTLYYYAQCNATENDCMGNEPPAKGLEPCESGNLETGVSKVVECGGLKYIPSSEMSKCVAECSYEDDKAKCDAKGGSFTPMCQTSTGQVFGKCSVGDEE